MNILDRIQQSGWGAVFLFIYSVGILYFLPVQLGRLVFVISAATPSLVLVFLSIVFNDWLMDLFAGDVIRESFETIDDRTGDDEFYYDADSDTQDSIDERDKKAHQHLVSVLSGIVIAVSLPFVVYYLHGLREVVLALIGSVIVGYLLSVRELRSLRQVVKSSVKLYDIDNED